MADFCVCVSDFWSISPEWNITRNGLLMRLSLFQFDYVAACSITIFIVADREPVRATKSRHLWYALALTMHNQPTEILSIHNFDQGWSIKLHVSKVLLLFPFLWKSIQCFARKIVCMCINGSSAWKTFSQFYLCSSMKHKISSCGSFDRFLL